MKKPLILAFAALMSAGIAAAQADEMKTESTAPAAMKKEPMKPETAKKATHHKWKAKHHAKKAAAMKKAPTSSSEGMTK